MFGKLLLLFILVPLADLFLLMILSSYTGWPFSISIVILSGIVGAYLAKRSYRSVWSKVHAQMATQQVPTELLTDGAMIFFAAGLLLTPGFITDAIGLTLLIPACRRWYKSWIARWLKNRFQFQVVTMNPANEDIVEGEVLYPYSGSKQKPPERISPN